MSPTNRPTWLGRRAVLLGGLGAAITGCSGGGTASAPKGSASPSASGPVINSQRLGNVITPDDLTALERTLSRTLAAGDWATFRTYLHRYDDHELWRRVLAGFQAVPMEVARFYVQRNDAKMNNASGGAVTASIDLAMAHQIRGCDAQPLAELVTAKIRKPKNGGPLAATSLQLNTLLGDTSPWELSPVVALESPHVVLIAREQDESMARAALPQVERGTARAMDYLPPAAGLDKLCVTLSWPGARTKLYGGTIDEAAGTAHSLSFVDPQELANAGGEEIEGRPFAGSRIVLEPSALTSPATTEKVSAHEAIHALATKWGFGAPAWYTEGYARWFELGRARGFSATERATARASFGGFRARHRSGSLSEHFYDKDIAVNYTCSSAVFSWAEDVHGADAPQALAKAAYTEGVADPAKAALGVSEDRILAQVADWL